MYSCLVWRWLPERMVAAVTRSAGFHYQPCHSGRGWGVQFFGLRYGKHGSADDIPVGRGLFRILARSPSFEWGHGSAAALLRLAATVAPAEGSVSSGRIPARRCLFEDCQTRSTSRTEAVCRLRCVDVILGREAESLVAMSHHRTLAVSAM